MLAKKDEVDPEELRKTTSALQQSSLKLFEIAYKKVNTNRRPFIATEKTNSVCFQMAAERESGSSSGTSDQKQQETEEKEKKQDKN